VVTKEIVILISVYVILPALFMKSPFGEFAAESQAIAPLAGRDTSRSFLFQCYEFLAKSALRLPPELPMICHALMADHAGFLCRTCDRRNKSIGQVVGAPRKAQQVDVEVITGLHKIRSAPAVLSTRSNTSNKEIFPNVRKDLHSRKGRG
jgi:hypothetical protein